MKINKTLIVLLLLTGSLLTGCSSLNLESAPPGSGIVETTTEIAAEITDSDQTQFLWQITLLDSEIKESLHTTGSTTLYDGTVKELLYDDSASSGNVFLLLNLSIAKAQPGNSSFDWEKVVVRDEQGNEYPRHINDSFLTSHKYERMPATSLKLGETSGWACFEINSAKVQGKLYFVYKAEEGENNLQIK